MGALTVLVRPCARCLAYADLSNDTLPARWSPSLHALDSIGCDRQAPGCVLHVSPGQNRGRQSPLCCGGRIPAARRVSDVGPDIGRPSPAALPSGDQRSVPVRSTIQTQLVRNGHLLVAATVQRRRTPPATPSRSFPRTRDRSLAADLSDLRFSARRIAIAGRGEEWLRWGDKVGNRHGVSRWWHSFY